jgi:serine O-acetyltransferase
MDNEGYRSILLSDLKRYMPNGVNPLKCYLMNSGFRYAFWVRTAKYCSGRKGILSFLLYVLSKFVLVVYFIRYRARISSRSIIGPGLYLEHPDRLVVGPEAIIGKNCTLQRGVSVGAQCRGRYYAPPTIKDNVHISENAMIIGDIEVGENVFIGPSSIVRKDVPDNFIVRTLSDFLGLK